jgi:hypothetical protein
MRPHQRCWTDTGYQHICHEPSGYVCDTDGCGAEAGTWWTPYWCPDCDVDRLSRISAELDAMLTSLHRRAQ